MVSMKKLSGLSNSDGRFGCVGKVRELAANTFRDLSTELVLDKEAFSVEGVLVIKPFSIELPRVRDARVGGFETLEERA